MRRSSERVDRGELLFGNTAPAVTAFATNQPCYVRLTSIELAPQDLEKTAAKL